jgi:hypothetical protein
MDSVLFTFYNADVKREPGKVPKFTNFIHDVVTFYELIEDTNINIKYVDNAYKELVNIGVNDETIVHLREYITSSYCNSDNHSDADTLTTIGSTSLVTPIATPRVTPSTTPPSTSMSTPVIINTPVDTPVDTPPDTPPNTPQVSDISIESGECNQLIDEIQDMHNELITAIETITASKIANRTYIIRQLHEHFKELVDNKTVDIIRLYIVLSLNTDNGYDISMSSLSKAITDYGNTATVSLCKTCDKQIVESYHNHNTDRRCVICYTISEPTVLLTCGHVMHHTCISHKVAPSLSLAMSSPITDNSITLHIKRLLNNVSCPVCHEHNQLSVSMLKLLSSYSNRKQNTNIKPITSTPATTQSSKFLFDGVGVGLGVGIGIAFTAALLKPAVDSLSKIL